MATDWLKKLRLGKFPSQTAAARAAGITPSRYSRLENGYSDLREEEIDALAKALDVTVDELRRGQPAVAEPKEVKVKAPIGVGAARVAEASQPIQTIVPPAPKPIVVDSAAEAKQGDNLDDPKNFSLMPPADLLLRNDVNDAALRAQLQKAVTFAEKVLHTSKVRPAVWVAWRDFSKDAQKVLRGAGPAVVPVEPKPIEIPKFRAPKREAVAPAPLKGPAKDAKPRLHGNKNVFGHFVDVAREWLAPAASAALNEKALAAKTSNPEMGFMKHFRRIAEIELPREEFERIDREATQRDGSG